MSSVTTADALPEEGDRDRPRLVSREGDTLVMAPVSLDGSVLTDEPAVRQAAAPADRRAGHRRPGHVDLLAALDAADADRQARREPRVGHVLVLIPAHNEAASIAHTLRSLQEQTTPPAEIVVVCDNCTDATAAISTANGARVMTTVGNTKKKAGALNQALECALPQVARDDLILAMDADSQLCSDWIERAVASISRNQKIGAVCGVFLGETAPG